MKRISAYQATDGAMFSDRKECKEHQKKLDTIARIQAVAESLNTDPKYYSAEIGGGSCISNPEQLAMFILENADELRDILNGKAPLVADTAESVAPTDEIPGDRDGSE